MVKNAKGGGAGMLRVFVLGSTALMSGIFWALIVEPWLDRRPRNGSFVEPQKSQKEEKIK